MNLWDSVEREKISSRDLFLSRGGSGSNQVEKSLCEGRRLRVSSRERRKPS
jgi:hypothetical protein